VKHLIFNYSFRLVNYSKEVITHHGLPAGMATEPVELVQATVEDRD
jgi:hypothetical protein